MSTLFECGNAWESLGDPHAVWELLRYLRSPEIDVRNAAEEFLVEAGPRSIKLLQAAFIAGVLEAESAVPCLINVMTLMWWDGYAENADFNPFPYDC